MSPGGPLSASAASPIPPDPTRTEGTDPACRSGAGDPARRRPMRLCAVVAVVAVVAPLAGVALWSAVTGIRCACR